MPVITIEAVKLTKEQKRNLVKELTTTAANIIIEIAEKYNKSVAQVILRWLTQREVVVIPNLFIKKESSKTSISLILN
jgi:diketogulonate reductase-like aldo/keto reductase